MHNDKLIKLVRNEELDAVSDIVISAIGVAFPVVSLLTMVGKAVMKIISSRTHAYKSSLAKDIVSQLQALSENEEFIQMFYLTFQSALKSHNDEKASAFARLLSNGYEENLNIDELFEFNEILNMLSVREMLYLEKLKDMPRGENSSEEDYANQLNEWKTCLMDDFGEDLQYIDSVYIKLQGYGFCRKWSHREFLGQRFNEFWELTPYYKSFYKYISENEFKKAGADNCT